MLEDHAELLHGSGVLPEVARARGYESVQQRYGGRSGLLLPVWTVHGRRAWTQIRYDAPHGHRWRYENGPDAYSIVDCPPAARPRVLDPEEPLYITESPRKADAAISYGLACVAFPGIRMLSLDDATWEYIGVTGRDVRIVFDGDAAIKTDVEAAEWWLREYLMTKGAKVTVHRLPPYEGLDDYLSSGKTIETLPLANIAREPPKVRWSPSR